MFYIDFDPKALLAALTELKRLSGDLSGPLKAIGEDLVESTKRRIELGRDLNGRPFAPNSPVTVARKGHNRPLIDSGTLLHNTIHYDVQGDTLIVGSSSEYAALQQFGQRKGASGKNRRGAPIPWGDIPARPFIGLSQEDETYILRTLTEAIEKVL